MNPIQLVIKEIRFRKSGFVVSLVSVVAAVAVITGTMTLITVQRHRIETLIAQRQADAENEMAQMRDDYRRYMKDMGYNSIILHKNQSFTDFIASGRIAVDMPEAYVHKLAQSPRASYNHLMPVLLEMTRWPEVDMDILLCGTPGQVPVQAKPRFWTEDGYIDPIRTDIPAGHIEVGYSLAEESGLAPGQSVVLKGQTFIIHRVLPSQGGMEDISVWCGLDEVQRWFEKPGKINAIFALECMGDGPKLGGIVNHVPTILPDTQVRQFSTLIAARINARNRASQASAAAIDAEIEHRQRVVSEYSAFASLLFPIVPAASGVWLFLLFLDNVRRRKTETGLLRAVGVKESVIMTMFMLKAAAIGLMGALAGYFSGAAVGAAFGGIHLLSGDFLGLIRLPMFAAVMLMTPVLCALAGWFPARRAARVDPVQVLADE